MVFANEKYLIIALIAPTFAAIMFLYGAYKNEKNLKRLARSRAIDAILLNFCKRQWRAKAALCTFIPVIYAFALAELTISDALTTKIDAVPYLIAILVLLLMLESLFTCRKWLP
jgi:hypothetical protein